MYVITIETIKDIIQNIGVAQLISQIREQIYRDFTNWEDFNHSSRLAHYLDEGVIELMPTGNKDYYSYKYVNGHPGNVEKGYSSIMALGQLSDCHTGTPILLSEMTILTALRTAATTQLVAMYGARKNSSVLAIIGNGAQSIFQTIAICEQFPIHKIQYFDIDMAAMETFSKHIHTLYPDIILSGMSDSHKAAQGADIIITVTEAFGQQEIVSLSDVKLGAFIAGVGGDCPGKTEIDPELVRNADILVEYESQTRKEGELQRCIEKKIHAHIYELTQGKKTARKTDDSIVLFDSVGFAIEDYSALQVMYNIAKEQKISTISLIPENMGNVKDLYGFLHD